MAYLTLYFLACYIWHVQINFDIRRDHQINYLCASWLWGCRRKEPILGYVLKNVEKKNQGKKNSIYSPTETHTQCATRNTELWVWSSHQYIHPLTNSLIVTPMHWYPHQRINPLTNVFILSPTYSSSHQRIDNLTNWSQGKLKNSKSIGTILKLSTCLIYFSIFCSEVRIKIKSLQEKNCRYVFHEKN